MKEGNEPTRRRVLICICLKWQVREQEEGCGFLPFRRRRGAELRGAELLSEPLSTLVPPTNPTCHLHPRQEERGQGEITGMPSKKAWWKPRKSIKAQPAASRVPPGFNSSSGERMGRARGGQSHRTVNGRRTGSPRTRLGLIEHHQRSAPNWCVWSTAPIPGKKENHASQFSQVPLTSKLPTKPLGAGKKASSQPQHPSVSRRGGPNLNLDLNHTSQASEEVKPRTEGKISEKRSPTSQ